jgi:hypothetical protein
MLPAIENNVGGIENPRHLRHKPKFLCRTCEGYHLTHLCPTTVGIPKAWFSPKGPLGFEVSMVSPHPVSPLIDTEVMLLQSSHDHTPIFDGDVSPIPIIMHLLQPRIEEVVVLVQFLVNPTLLMEGDASSNHVVNIPDNSPYKHERVLLSPSTLPLNPKEFPFDWDGLMGYPMPPPMSFLLRDFI